MPETPTPSTTDDLRAGTDRREGPRRDTEQRLHLATQLTLMRARAVVTAYAAASGEVVGDHRLRTELRELATMIGALDDALAAVDAR